MKTIKILLVAFLLLSLIGCDDNSFLFIDETPPDVPQNIITETGDNLVVIEWDHVNNSDLAGYSVYYSDSYDGQYNLLGTTPKSSYIDYGAANGETYYYAVSSYDINGNESELSYDVAYDTPRPEGFNETIFDFRNYPDVSGYDFSKYYVDKYNSINTDFFFDNDDGSFYLNVWEDTDIQNMGRTTNIYDISYAPTEGWVELKEGDNIKYTKAVRGNTYVIWTADNHFAKIRINEIFLDHIDFDWAYQTAPGNVELKINRKQYNKSRPSVVKVRR